MPRLFLSYRRKDSPQATGRIYDKFVNVYGRENVFKDVDSIPLGIDFRRALEESLSHCDAVIAVIGNAWVHAADQVGNRRLDDPADYVRIEIELALNRHVRLLPLLVDGAGMPTPDDLPVSLRDLAYRNAMPVRVDPDFHTDMDRVIRTVGNPRDGSVNHPLPTALSSNVSLLAASLDPHDSPYQQTIEDGRAVIRPKLTTPEPFSNDHD